MILFTGGKYNPRRKVRDKNQTGQALDIESMCQELLVKGWLLWCRNAYLEFSYQNTITSHLASECDRVAGFYSRAREVFFLHSIGLGSQ